MKQAFRCKLCGKEHGEIPDVVAAAPFAWSEELRQDPASMLSSDLCIIEGRDFFIRGVIDIPILDSTEVFGFGVWISQKKENFEIYRDNFQSSAIGPFFGWLNTEINFYAASTMELKTMAHFRGAGNRPLIKLEPSEHPLSRHQRDGISLGEAWEIAHFYGRDF